MRIRIPVMGHFRSELEDPNPPRGTNVRRDLDGICRTQIGLLETVQQLAGALLPQGWDYEYDAATESVILRNDAVQGGDSEDAVIAYLRNVMPQAAVENAREVIRFR